MSIYLKKYTNDQSRFLVIDHTLVHYRVEGEGPPLLLLHGAFSSLHTFDGWVEHLKKDFQLIRLDLPGFGLSQASDDHEYHIEKYLHSLSRFLEILEIEQIHIAGSSLGGWLSWEFCLAYPEKVHKLVLIDAAGHIDEQSVPLPFKMARTPLINKLVRYVIKRNVLEVFVRQVYGDPSRVSPELVDRYFDLFSREGNPEAFLALANGTFEDRTHLLPDIQAPTLIMWGEKDEWLPLKNAYHFLKSIPRAELIIYEDLGHIPMEEEARQTAKDVRKFLLREE